MHSIWIADDDEAIRLVLEESLSSSGYKTKSFCSGEDLVKELEKQMQQDSIGTNMFSIGDNSWFSLEKLTCVLQQNNVFSIEEISIEEILFFLMSR